MLAIVAMLILVSCQSTYQSTSSYDDVYYSPGSSDQAVAQKRVGGSSDAVSYGNNSSEDRFENTTQPQSEIIGSDNYSQGSASAYYQDTLIQPESSSNEYYYSEESDEYYDYEYASRIKRFHEDCGDFGYYAPVYNNVYSPGFSMGFGYGWPSSYMSMSFGYGWGYPYYGYYDPWYYPYYDPWYYPYYPYYGGSYWMGYNQGYYNGYWNGYYGGGYYPEGGDGYGYYYGPRGTRGSGLIGSTDNRESRMTNDVNVEKTAPVETRTSRSEPGSLFGSGLSQQGTEPNNVERVNRQSEVQQQNVNSEANSVTRDVRAEKLAKPSSVEPAVNTSKNEVITREVRNSPGVNAESNKLSKPVINNESSGIVQDRNVRTSTQQQKIAKPASSVGNSNVVSREKKYAKPASNSLERPSQTKNYNSPTYNKPRASNEYTVPGSRTIRTTPQGENSSERVTTAPAQQNNIRTSTPSKSNSSFSSPTRSTINSSSRPAKTYSAPSSTSTPQRSYSAPARSSGGGSYSAPASSGGSRSSGGSSNGGSSSGSSGGRRGR